MNIIKVDPENMRASLYGLQKAAELILRGGVVVVPTDTVYGLAADATNPQAVAKLFRMKKRAKTKPVPLIIRNMEMAKELAYIDKRLEKILGFLWPGAITIILQKRAELPELVTAGKRTVGLRLPDYKLLYYLLEVIGRPLTATSANISGEAPSIDAEKVVEQFRKEFSRPDLVLDAGKLKFSQPSTVLDLATPEPKIIRIGPVNPRKLMEILSI
ncbi:MAG: threonylcarbamoyl-AMP synthase [Candidatus Portnoybacteria bacterium RBG_19FT_COMBO_36_7]|uniref:L-threonylcarbamoyladenylate synthase n=1 Tax=Candidatus Portnoybacteria bacterium RBG_19FT_COMBO_36_7 TaxID=1801992 RepID=A0A1G2F6Z6_9BACT|nr:MAG: threonylcarbamoyl-AMP synthase [Candidatus Portnoybacteria bacterium RBG_19FT_COMBO_36_7]